MKNINLKDVILRMFEKKLIVLIVVLICMILLGFHGYVRATDGNSAETQKKLDEYNMGIAEYEEAIALIQDNIKVSEEQAKKQQEYNENALYMKLDPNNMYVVNIQYAVSPGENVGLGNLLASYVQYVNTGDFYKNLGEAIADESDAYSVEYLKELGWVGTNNNIFIFTLSCVDQNMADKVLDEAVKIFEAKRPDIVKVQGGHEIKLLQGSIAINANMDVLNKQQTNITNLKNYTNSLADNKTKLANNIAARDSYIEKNKPENIVTDSPVKALIKWIIFGFIVGLCICLGVTLIIYVHSDELKSKDDMLYAKVPVIVHRNKNGEYRRTLNAVKKDIEIMSKQRNVDTSAVAVYSLSDTDKAKIALGEILKETGVKSDSDMSSLAEKGNVILLVECRNTKYVDIEETHRLLDILKINLWGCIVVD